MTDKDKEWIEGFRSRDTRALEAVIDSYGPGLHGLVLRILSGIGSSEDAEECVSDAFLAAWRGIEQFDEERSSFKTWLYMIAKYKALDKRRQLSRSGRTWMLAENAGLKEGSAEQYALSRETSHELIQVIRTLGEPDRSLFWHRYYLYEELEQLAQSFGLTKKAVENRLYRCRTALRQAMRLTEAEGFVHDK